MNILIISNLDRVWMLPAFSKLINKAKGLHQFKLILVPEKLGKLSKWQSVVWSFKVFGFKSSFLLTIYSLLNLLKYYFTTNALIREAIFLKTFESEFILETIRECKIDLVFISSSNIIPKDLLEASKIPWVNKHSSILPASKGLFPYIWSVINSFDLGVTYHRVSERIDGGEVLLQYKINNSTSMINFNKFIYDALPTDLLHVVEIISNTSSIKVLNLNYSDSYFSLPLKNDLKEFRSKGGSIINLQDLKFSAI